MELKSPDQIYELEAFCDYKASKIEHFFIYVQNLDQYALISHSGILFDDYKFIEDIDIIDDQVEDLDCYIRFIEDSLGPIVKITAKPLGTKPRGKVQQHRSQEEILGTNEHFRKYKRVQANKLFWSEKLDKYYLATEKGIMFDDGVFYPHNECIEMQTKSLSIKAMIALHAAKYEFGWDEARLID